MLSKGFVNFHSELKAHILPPLEANNKGCKRNISTQDELNCKLLYMMQRRNCKVEILLDESKKAENSLENQIEGKIKETNPMMLPEAEKKCFLLTRQ